VLAEVMTLAFMAFALQAALRLTRAFLTRRVGEGMVEGRATMDREHFMTVAPIPAVGHSHRQCHYRCHRLSIYHRAGWNGESTV